MPESDFQELALAVAGNARDAEDFAGADREADIVEPLHAERVHRVLTMIDRERRFAGLGARAVRRHAHLAADHQHRQLLAVGLGGLALGHDFAVAHHRHRHR